MPVRFESSTLVKLCFILKLLILVGLYKLIDRFIVTLTKLLLFSAIVVAVVLVEVICRYTGKGYWL